MEADEVVHPDRHSLLQLASHVLMDVSGEDIPAITAQMAAVSKVAPGKHFVAMGVQTLEAFHMCHKLQFALFMGPFITRREKLDTPTMGPSRAKVLDLMNRVRTGAEQPELAEQFRHDPALSVRLLRYVNSPGMGLMNKVGGIEQALMVMGQDKLYRWLTLILFTGGQAQELDQAVLENALARGRMAEQLAGRALFAKARDEIFVAGLFSLLDVVMNMPMEQAAQADQPAGGNYRSHHSISADPMRPIWRWPSLANNDEQSQHRSPGQTDRPRNGRDQRCAHGRAAVGAATV